MNSQGLRDETEDLQETTIRHFLIPKELSKRPEQSPSATTTISLRLIDLVTQAQQRGETEGDALRTRKRSTAALCIAALGTALLLVASPARSNGIGENAGWQFQTQADRVNKSAVADLMERKKAGYYDSFRTVNYNTSNTYVDKQFNCAVTSSAAGNGGQNAMNASTSSPTVTNSGTTSAATNANSATNGVGGYPSVLVASASPVSPFNGSVDNNQSNSGALNSGVTGSSTSATTGAITAGGGTSDQVLNSTQSNSGAQTASVNGSTACNGPLIAQ
jgi:hypothetical protein